MSGIGSNTKHWEKQIISLRQIARVLGALCHAWGQRIIHVFCYLPLRDQNEISHG